MKVKDHLMQAHFIEIHQVLAKKKPDIFVTEKSIKNNLHSQKVDTFTN